MMDILQRLSAIEEKFSKIIRVGTVSTYNEKSATARVVFHDKVNIDSSQKGLVSYDLPILVKQTQSTKDYWIPDKDEQVLCVFLPNMPGQERGFILGSFYSKTDTPSASSKNKRSITFEDGTLIEYDKSSHSLTVNSKGKVNIITETDTSITSKGKTSVTSTGDATITTSGKATVNASSEVTVKGSKINLDTSGSSGAVVTTKCLCQFTGGLHPEGCDNVTATK